MKKALVCGAGGFIAGRLTQRLKEEAFWVRSIDLKLQEHAPLVADDLILGDQHDQAPVHHVSDPSFDEIATTSRLTEVALTISGTRPALSHILGLLSVRGPSSDNLLIANKQEWRPTRPPEEGLTKADAWIHKRAQAWRAE